ncbi:MAG TPA: cob(I)yrinic acid a,c-diamide adenosyltransferase, partial [Candidatus Krumholzibacteria bacterium]|nr:cob(I)yrinic acid a,c-diamide adenosyltransferase [Candidatus Krumholzibacteria bacterium]
EGFTWETKNRERDTAVAWKTWEACREAIEKNEHDLLVFDEINNAIHYGYLDIAPVLAALHAKPKDMHVILTGRDAHPDLIAFADLVTEMREIKHPFHRGIYAQRGIEY